MDKVLNLSKSFSFFKFPHSFSCKNASSQKTRFQLNTNFLMKLKNILKSSFFLCGKSIIVNFTKKLQKLVKKCETHPQNSFIINDIILNLRASKYKDSEKHVLKRKMRMFLFHAHTTKRQRKKYSTRREKKDMKSCEFIIQRIVLT